MYKRRLPIYQRRSRQPARPVFSLLALVTLMTIIGGMFALYDRMRVPGAGAPRATLPASLMGGPPTALPLALPTALPPDTHTTIFIPTAGVRTGVVEVYLDGISWDVSRLGYNAGHLQGTASLTGRGNLVLAGHVEMADGRPGVFAGIGSLEVGDPLIISRGALEKRYAVSAVKTVAPDDLSVLYPTTTDRITLITCGDYDFFQNVYQERIVVVADRAA